MHGGKVPIPIYASSLTRRQQRRRRRRRAERSGTPFTLAAGTFCAAAAALLAGISPPWS